MRLWVTTYKSLKTMRKSSWVIPKVVTVAYGNSSLQELSMSKWRWHSKQDLHWWLQLELITYKRGRSESFDCTLNLTEMLLLSGNNIWKKNLRINSLFKALRPFWLKMQVTKPVLIPLINNYWDFSTVASRIFLKFQRICFV